MATASDGMDAELVGETMRILTEPPTSRGGMRDFDN